MQSIYVRAFSLSVLVLVANGALGQSYPNKPIRIVTGGGATEFMARLVAQGISGPLGQPVILENRPSTVQAEIVAKATADGYTALVSGSNGWLAPLTRKASYDPLRDLAPISMLGTTPLVLFVHPSLAVKSVKELIALAKSKPGELNFSVGGIGGTSHLAGELFKSMAGINIVAVPYSSGSLELQDLMGGRVQLTFTTPASLMEQVKLGKLRALAVTSAEPSSLVPDLPTVAASGLVGYEWGQSIAMLVPSGTPKVSIDRLNQEVVKFLNTSEAKEKAVNVGVEAVGTSSDHLAAIIKSDLAKVAKVIKEAGIQTR